MPELSVTEEQLERIETVRTELEAAFLDGYGHMRRHDAIEYLLDTYTPPAERNGNGTRHSTGNGIGNGTSEAIETDDEAAVEATTPDDTADVEERVREALDREVRDEEGDIDYPSLQSVARDTEGVKGSGMGAEEMYEAVVEAKVRELEAGEVDEIDVSVDETGKVETDDTDGAEGEQETDAAEGDEAAADVDATDEDEADEDEPSETEASEEGSSESVTAASGGGGGSQLQAMMNLLKTHDDKWRKAASGDAPYEVDLPDGGTESARTKDDVKRVLFTNY